MLLPVPSLCFQFIQIDVQVTRNEKRRMRSKENTESPEKKKSEDKSSKRTKETTELPVKKKSEDKSLVSPIKKKKRKRSQENVVQVKQECDSSELDTSLQSDNSPEKKKSKTYESYITGHSKSSSRKQNEQPIVLTLKSPIVEEVSKKRHKKGAVEAKETVETTGVVIKQEEVVPSEVPKVTSKKKESGGKKVRSDKQLLSSKKKKKDVEKESEELSQVENTELLDASVDGKDVKVVKQKKKSKKKNKKKLQEKHHKIIHVQSFPVEDQSVIKVKKKKIYKKRKGVKILVRIIKNHCNKNGEIVKTETVLVDHASIKEEGEIVIKSEGVNLEEHAIIEGKPLAEEDKVIKQEETEEMTEVQEPIKEVGTGEIKKENAPETLDSMTDYMSSIVEDNAEERCLIIPHVKKLSNKKHAKKSVVKKSTKLFKKSSARPANKNVTVGGKVVGKTTKGMKKTGVAVLDAPRAHKPPAQETHSERERETEPVSSLLHFKQYFVLQYTIIRCFSHSACELCHV